jgi:hypothetical protein
MGFGLIARFLELIDTARDYNLQFTITHTTLHNYFTAVA